MSDYVDYTDGVARIDPTCPNRILVDAINGFDPLTGKNVIGGTCPDHPDGVANARHLVACWNFCLGLNTEALERAASSPNRIHTVMQMRG